MVEREQGRRGPSAGVFRQVIPVEYHHENVEEEARSQTEQIESKAVVALELTDCRGDRASQKGGNQRAYFCYRGLCAANRPAEDIAENQTDRN